MGIVTQTQTTRRASGPAIRVFSETNPAPLDYLAISGGYLGTVLSDRNMVAEATRIADLRRAAAVAGGYAVQSFRRSEEIKGVLGEMFMRLAYQGAVSAGRVQFSELLLDRPDARPDLVINVPDELVDLLDCDLVDVKASCERISGVQDDRSDSWFMVSETDMTGYVADGLTGILFVHVVSPTRAHLAYASVAYILKRWTLSKTGERLTPKYPAYVRTMTGVIPGK